MCNFLYRQCLQNLCLKNYISTSWNEKGKIFFDRKAAIFHFNECDKLQTVAQIYSMNFQN